MTELELIKKLEERRDYYLSYSDKLMWQSENATDTYKKASDLGMSLAYKNCYFDISLIIMQLEKETSNQEPECITR